METTKDNKEFDTMKRHEQKNNTPYRAKSNRRETLISCTHYEYSHMLNIWKEMLIMLEDKPFEKVCRSQSRQNSRDDFR